MKSFIGLRQVIVVILSILTTTSYAQNFNEGYCVSLGEKVSLENAVVIVKDHKVNNYPLSEQRNHNFFDFLDGSNMLHFVDWEGGIILKKITLESKPRKKTAIFSDLRHGVSAEAILVECSSLELHMSPLSSFLINEVEQCPTDPKTCAYYYCRHSWPPVGCL